MKIVNVKIAGLSNPLGLDDTNPIITWELLSEDKNVKQLNCHIRVFHDDIIVWDSGKKETENQKISYSGAALKPCTKYSLELCATDTKNNVAIKTAEWETGFLNQKKWEAKWIESNRDKRQNVEAEDLMGAAVFENDIQVSSVPDLYPVIYFEKKINHHGKKVKRARIYATAHGIYEVEIDGEKVGDMELAPEFSAYQDYLQYQTYDVTNKMKNDEQILHFWLADGYYIGRIGVIGVGYEYGDNTAILFQIEVEYEDGSRQILVSDEECLYTESYIRYSDIFIGEKQDMRIKNTIVQREACGLNPTQWMSPIIKDYGYESLIGQSAEPVRLLLNIPAVEIIRTPKNETVIDFGQVLAGRVRISVNGIAGQEISLTHQETLDEYGDFYYNIGTLNCDQKDSYILCDGMQILEPRFTFHGFRYVKVEGLIENIKPEQCIAVVMGSDCEKTGIFQCSDKRLNQLQHNIEWSQKANIFSIPTDCPQRERAGWTGDIQIYAPTACYNMYMVPFFKRWLAQMRAEQLETGEVPVVVPYNEGYRNMQMQFGGTTSAGWGDACVILPWTLYQHYDDISFLNDNYEMMNLWMNYVATEAAKIPDDMKEASDHVKECQKYLWNAGFHFGDWLYPSAKNPDGSSNAFLSAVSTKDMVAPAMYAYSVQTMEKVCHALGKKDKAEYYRELDDKIKNAFDAVYVDENGHLPMELQGLYVLALQMDLIPKSKRSGAIERLVHLIEANNGCLDTGFLSVPFLLDVLYNNGKKEEAYKLLYNEKCPSWLYEVKKGATTIWESWDAVMENGRPNKTSFNHYAFGCVGDWIYRTILGLKQKTVGYKEIIIEPDFDCGLTWAFGSYHSIYGEIVIRWEKNNKNIMLNVHVPVNTTAEIILKYHNQKSTRVVGSGTYDFNMSVC